MSRTKRTSVVAKQAATRAAGLSSISPTLDLGHGLTLSAYNSAIDAIINPSTGKLVAYNTTLSLADQQLNDLQAAEKALATMGDRMRMAVAAQYGKDSSEYEKAGGVRTSERKAPVRKAKVAPAA